MRRQERLDPRVQATFTARDSARLEHLDRAAVHNVTHDDHPVTALGHLHQPCAEWQPRDGRRHHAQRVPAQESRDGVAVDGGVSPLKLAAAWWPAAWFSAM